MTAASLPACVAVFRTGFGWVLVCLGSAVLLLAVAGPLNAQRPLAQHQCRSTKDSTGTTQDGPFTAAAAAAAVCYRGTLARVAADWQPQSNEEDVLRLLLLLQDVARGLKLLHTKHIIHADLVSC